VVILAHLVAFFSIVNFNLWHKDMCLVISSIDQIPLARYLPTWRGNVIDEEIEMNPSRVLGMSLSVNAEGGVPGAKSGPGDFRLELDWIKAIRTQ
jgi:hypothetical protein